MSVGFLASWHGADAVAATRAVFSTALFHAGDFGMGPSGTVATLPETLLDRDPSEAMRALRLADSTAAGLPAHSVLGDAAAPASAEQDRLTAMPVCDLPAAAVDCCFDENVLGEQRADAFGRIDAAENTGTSRAAALAVIPLIFSRFEEDPTIGQAESRRRWHRAIRERR
jgi:hypothetical protein